MPPGLPPRPELDRRIDEGVRALRARFGERMRLTPSVADPKPPGDGPPNRHGMPRLPPGQNDFGDEWPVLDLGQQPVVTREAWRLVVDGAVEEPLDLGFDDLLALPQVELTIDFHCVTGWSRLDLPWKGVRFETVVALARPTGDAVHVMTHAKDGYSTNLPLEEALKDDVLLAHEVERRPLDTDHGGPVRVVTPQLYAYKGAKWLTRIELVTRPVRGYWEIRGYSNTAYPWRDDRSW